MVIPTSETRLRRVLAEAETWSEGGYTETSRTYWQGMRDTLRAILGITTEIPSVTGPGADIAALLLLEGS